MKNSILYILLSFLLFACSEDVIDGDERGTIRGSVRLALSNEPLANVKITTQPTTLTVYTDEDGKFEISDSVPIGDYTVKAELNGYLTEIKSANLSQFDQIVSIDFEMVTDETLNIPPTTPELLSPANMAVNLPNDLILKWSSSDADNDELTYRILLSDNITNSQVEFENIKVDSLIVEDLSFGATYTWQVVVNDGINPDVFSGSSQFTVRNNPEYRYHFVQKVDGNYIIKSTNLDETITITSSAYSSWRPHKNNIAERVAFLQTIGGQTHLVTSDLNGGNPLQVSQTPLNGFRADQLDFAWHTDGSRLIYPNFDKLYQVFFNGTGQQLIYQTADGQFITKCAWSYDGSKIALVTNDIYGYNAKIIIIDSAGNLIDTIFENQAGAVGGLDWNITGDKLLFTHDVSGYQDNQYRQLDTHIIMYDLDSGDYTDYSQISAKPSGTLDLDPRFTPDDAQIIFTNTSNDMLSVKSIYIIELDFPDTRDIKIFNAEMPDYQ